MLSGKEALAGGYRLANVKRVKRYLFIIQIIILILIPIIVVLIEGRASLVPFYLPLNSFIYFILLMALIMVVEGFFFKILEMRLIQSPSTNYYIAKSAIRQGIVVVAISAFVVFLLWTPFMSQAIENSFNNSDTLHNTNSTAASEFVVFYDRDPLGLGAVDQITVTASGGAARVYLVSEKNYLNYSTDLSGLIPFRVNSQDYIVDGQLEIHLNPLPYGKYYLVLDTVRSDASSVNVVIHSAISPTFLSYVPFFALLFIVAYGVWMAYMLPVKRKFASGAIYH
ncbi:MAG: hypothetical protein LUO85_00530 [Methanomassiliicoccales archaeon]|nr:hypothetical protein [Methanomassiliicoccales archaeon]